jgi:hypothetical protein
MARVKGKGAEKRMRRPEAKTGRRDGDGRVALSATRGGGSLRERLKMKEQTQLNRGLGRAEARWI